MLRDVHQYGEVRRVSRIRGQVEVLLEFLLSRGRNTNLSHMELRVDFALFLLDEAEEGRFVVLRVDVCLTEDAAVSFEQLLLGALDQE